MDWRSFSFRYHLDTKNVLPVLVTIEAYKEAADKLILPPDWREQLDRLNRIRAVHGTTALEGNPLSEAEVSLQMDLMSKPEERTAPKATKEQLQIRNAGQAQSWVKLRFQADAGHLPMRLADIHHMYHMLTERSDETNNLPGRFRTFSVVVGSRETGGVHRGAPYEDVPQLMDAYISFLNSPKLLAQRPVIRALLAHFFLVTIHPFGDGNGRVSRLVEAGILFQGGYNVHGFYGLSNYFYRHEGEYKALLQKCRQKQPFDVTPFVMFGLHGCASELKGINNFIKAKLNRVIYRSMLARSFKRKTGDRRRLLNQREYNLLDFLLDATEPLDPFSDNPSRQIKFSDLREEPYIKVAYKSVTPRTFHRELLRLGNLGFIDFKRLEGADEPIVELNFGAIAKY